MSLEKLLVFNAAAQLAQATCANAGQNIVVDPTLKDANVRAKNLMVWEVTRVFYAGIIGALADTTSWPEPPLSSTSLAGNVGSQLGQGLLPLAQQLLSNPAVTAALSAIPGVGNVLNTIQPILNSIAKAQTTPPPITGPIPDPGATTTPTK